MVRHTLRRCFGCRRRLQLLQLLWRQQWLLVRLLLAQGWRMSVLHLLLLLLLQRLPRAMARGGMQQGSHAAALLHHTPLLLMWQHVMLPLLPLLLLLGTCPLPI